MVYYTDPVAFNVGLRVASGLLKETPRAFKALDTIVKYSKDVSMKTYFLMRNGEPLLV